MAMSRKEFRFHKGTTIAFIAIAILSLIANVYFGIKNVNLKSELSACYQNQYNTAIGTQVTTICGGNQEECVGLKASPTIISTP